MDPHHRIHMLYPRHAILRRFDLSTFAAGALIVSVLTALPAFFVDRPPLNKLLLAIFLGVTVAAVVLILTPPRRDLTTDPAHDPGNGNPM
jgi:hypothetical protein